MTDTAKLLIVVVGSLSTGAWFQNIWAGVVGFCVLILLSQKGK